MRKLSLFCGVFLLPFLSLAQTNEQKEKKSTTVLDSVVVEAYRAGRNTPVSSNRMSSKEIRQMSPSQSLPMLLSLMPSVVSSTEGGSGLGPTSLRIRGSDGSRINVTINGIALNDAESQEVFWVNIPALSGFLQDVQLQRGVGTSTNGPGAFGASINMQTLHTSQVPYGVAEFSIGSYQTYLTTIGAGSGISKSGFSFDVRYSHNIGDGYVRNGKTNLNSLFATLGWYSGKTSLRLNYIFGDQKSGITWNGIPRERVEVDRRYNSAGAYKDIAGNIHYYDNETDNYQQHHIQSFYNFQITSKLLFSTTINFTKGDGYYENYKANKKYSDYGLTSQILGGNTYKKSDFIVRQAMDNFFIASNSTLNYKDDNYSITGGLSYSLYDGDHFGKMLWSMYNQNIPVNYSWYKNRGLKRDFNIFAKAEISLSEKLIAYTDLQYRRVAFDLSGQDKDFALLDQNLKYNFFNPKVGFTYNLNNKNQFYVSLAVGHKDPSRTDIKESIKSNSAHDIMSERVLDYEIGYKLNSANYLLSANIYLMEYKDQLVPTGKMSESGYVIKENVPHSYRRGIELATSFMINKYLKFDGNLSLSKNKIVNYTSWTDRYNNPNDWSPLPQTSTFYTSTNLAYSPETVSMAMLSYLPKDGSIISLNAKYVGKQFYDNTSRDYFSIPAYYVIGIKASKTIRLKKNSSIDISIFVDNLLNRKYISNGWVYTADFADGSKQYVEEGLFPQAMTNFTARVSYKF